MTGPNERTFVVQLESVLERYPTEWLKEPYEAARAEIRTAAYRAGVEASMKAACWMCAENTVATPERDGRVWGHAVSGRWLRCEASLIRHMVEEERLLEQALAESARGETKSVSEIRRALLEKENND